MKKTAVLFAARLLVASLLLALAGCGGGNAASGATSSVSTASEPATTAASGGEAATGDSGAGSAPSSTDATQAASDDGQSTSADKVFQPHELLSAQEASALIGKTVTLEDGSLFKDEESGTISERYKYDIGSSTIHGLVEVHQDGLRTGGTSIKDAFQSTKGMVKSESTAVQLGDDALTAGQGQLHMLYGSYYIVVAFDGDEYGTTELSAALNVKIGTKILENLKAKLG